MSSAILPTNRMNLRKALFEPGHLDIIELPDDGDKQSILNSKESIASINKFNGGCITCMIDGRILYIAAYYPLHRGVYEVFVLSSIYVSKYPKTFHREIVSWLEHLRNEEPDVHRFQTHSIADDKHDRWMERLGFVCEGTLKQYTSEKEDRRLWAMFIEG